MGLRLQCLPLLSLLAPESVRGPHARQLPVNLFLLERDLVRLFGAGPEARDVKAVVEVRSEVVHPADGEDDIHAELWEVEVSYRSLPKQFRGERRPTLNTSRFPPWSLRRMEDMVESFNDWWEVEEDTEGHEKFR